ncbi:MAG: hypothetical protein H0X24_23720 [Ktedonobacterales bacterium]|nr:hypothetical protein [Ktedonobacterales bacterium]
MANTEITSDPQYQAKVLGQLLSATNQTAPLHGAAAVVTSTHPILSNRTVNGTQTTIAHGLGYTPKIYSIVMRSAGTIWYSAAADATNIYLTADTAARVCDIILGF